MIFFSSIFFFFFVGWWVVVVNDGRRLEGCAAEEVDRSRLIKYSPEPALPSPSTPPNKCRATLNGPAPPAKQCCHSRCRRRLFSRGYFSVSVLGHGQTNGKSSSRSLQSNFRPENVIKAIIIKIMAMIMTSWWLLLFTGLPRGWYKDVDNSKATENSCIQWHSGLSERWTERREIATKKTE